MSKTMTGDSLEHQENGDAAVAGNLTVGGNERVLGNLVVDGMINQGGGAGGTVFSVGLIAPSWLTVTGSPITTSGNFTLSGTSTGTGTTSVLNVSPTLTTASNLVANPALKLTNTSSSGGGYMNTQLYPNLNGTMYQNFGQSQTMANSFVNFFYYVTAFDPTNYLGWSGWGCPTNMKMYASGQVVFPTASDSVSTTTGTIVTTGGIGVGGRITSNGLRIEDPSITGLGNFSMNGTGDFGVDYPAFPNGRLHLDSTGKLTLPQVLTSTSTTTGSIVTPGGMGLGGNLNIGGSLFAGTSNAFQYSEGSWTPTLSFSVGVSLDYTGGIQFGQYIKVGKTCTVYFLLIGSMTNSTGSDANILVTGLPFAMQNVCNGYLTPLEWMSGQYNAPYACRGSGVSTTTFQIWGVSRPGGTQQIPTQLKAGLSDSFSIGCEFTYITTT